MTNGFPVLSGPEAMRRAQVAAMQPMEDRHISDQIYECEDEVELLQFWDQDRKPVDFEKCKTFLEA